MKKKLLYISAIGLMLWACNPMDDINKQIDSDNPITNVNQNIDITLTKSDYESMGGNVATNHAFSSTDPSANYVPDFLKTLHPFLTRGSVARITYNFVIGTSDLAGYAGAAKYTLSADDYNSVSETVGSAGYFSPSNQANDYIPDILTNAIPDAIDGSHYIISYKYSPVDPNPNAIKRSALLDQTFGLDLSPFTTVSVTGDQTWVGDANYGAKMSGYVSGTGAVPNEDWLISPAINLDGYKDAVLNFSQVINFLNGQWDQITVAVSTDYNGTDPTTATWTALTIPNLPTGSNYTNVASGDVDLSAYDGQTIYIGFKYVSSDSNAATWEISNVAVSAVGSPVVKTSTVEEYYTFNSGWAKSTDAYYVKQDDYKAMGGSLAKYGDFSSSDNPDNYLPQLLASKFPYAQDGSSMVVAYKYYSGGLQTRADEYFFIKGAWSKYMVKTDQFILGNTDEWVFDPTVNYSMTKDDYQLVVDYVKANIGAQYVSSYGNNETYYGSNAYYGEFQAGPGNFDSSFATWQDAVKEAIGQGFLPSKFPDAVNQVDGIDVNYKITFDIYNGSTIYYVITFKCTKSGPNPQFTWVEGPTAK